MLHQQPKEAENFDSLIIVLTQLGYENLPTNKIQFGNGFNRNLKQSDRRCYKLNLINESIIKQLVIFNYTQSKIIIYGII